MNFTPPSHKTLDQWSIWQHFHGNRIPPHLQDMMNGLYSFHGINAAAEAACFWNELIEAYVEKYGQLHGKKLIEDGGLYYTTINVSNI